MKELQDRLRDMAQEMLAYCACRQGRTQEAFSLAERLYKKEASADRMILLGQISLRMGDRDKAVDYLGELVASGCDREDLQRLGADCLLEAAIAHFEEEDLSKTIDCILSARSLAPKNPSLEHVPEIKPEAKPVVFFLSGAYDRALELWEAAFKSNGHSIKTLHMAAISSLCLLDQNGPGSVEKKAALLEKSHRYWIALGQAEDYWRALYDERHKVYGNSLSFEDFQEIALSAGPSRCEGYLDKFRNEVGSGANQQPVELVSSTKARMDVERHSAGLLSSLRKKGTFNGPPGGLGLLGWVWGGSRLNQVMERMGVSCVGSAEWLVNGLHRIGTRKAFTAYLNKDYQACVDAVGNSKSASLCNVMGLSVVELLKSCLAAGDFECGDKVVRCIPKIPERRIKEEALDSLKELLDVRLRTLMKQGLEDEAAESLERIMGLVEKEPEEVKARLRENREALAGLLLKKAERKYDAGEMEEWLQCYDKALSFSADKAICEHEFSKIVRYHLWQLFKEQKIDEAVGLLEDLIDRYPHSTFLKSRRFFFLGLDRREKLHNIDQEVVELFEKAYNMDPDSEEIQGIYSNGLSNRAVEIANTAISRASVSGADSSTLARAKTAESMLLKALRIDPNNDHAKTNLVSIQSVLMKIS